MNTSRVDPMPSARPIGRFVAFTFTRDLGKEVGLAKVDIYIVAALFVFSLTVGLLFAVATTLPTVRSAILGKVLLLFT